VRVTLHNQESPDDPLNGSHVENPDRLGVVLDEFQLREPFILELEVANGFRLTVGVTCPPGSAQEQV
jgi:hypothetical protein